LLQELGARMLLGVIQAHPSLVRLCGLPLTDDVAMGEIHATSSFGFMGSLVLAERLTSRYVYVWKKSCVHRFDGLIAESDYSTRVVSRDGKVLTRH